MKTFAINVDVKEPLPMQPFEVVEGDTGNRIAVTVTNGGTPVALSGTYITAVFAGSMGACFQDTEDGSITVSGSTATIELRPTACGEGQVGCELQIWSSSLEEPESRADYDVLVTSARFYFYCRGAMLGPGALEALPETPLLAALLAEARQAEDERQAAESERESAFAALMAQAVALSKSGSGAPTTATEGAAGQLYFDLTGKQIYVCTEAGESYTWKKLFQPADGADRLTVTRLATYSFEALPAGSITLAELAGRLAGWYGAINGKQDALSFDQSPTSGSTACVASGGIWSALHAGDWQTIADYTIAADASEVEIDRIVGANGDGHFGFDELMLTVVGSISSSTVVRLYFNGLTSEYIRIATFGLSDADAPENCMTRVYCEKPAAGFASAERGYGGDSMEDGYSSGYAVHRGFCCLGITKYTAFKISAEGRGKFPSGTRFILQGRNEL